MTPDEIDQFVHQYLAYLEWNRLPERTPSSRAEFEQYQQQITERVRSNPHTDATDDMFSFIHDQPELAWDLLLKIVERADESALHLLGAGDLETFVSINAESFAERIEREIRSSAKIRTAFESLDIGSDTPVQVGRRFNNALRESGVAEEHIIDWWSEEGPPSNST